MALVALSEASAVRVAGAGVSDCAVLRVAASRVAVGLPLSLGNKPEAVATALPLGKSVALSVPSPLLALARKETSGEGVDSVETEKE